jgi:hypothetical protein
MKRGKDMQDKYTGQAGSFITNPMTGERVPAGEAPTRAGTGEPTAAKTPRKTAVKPAPVKETD